MPCLPCTAQPPWKDHHYAAVMFKVVMQGERLAIPPACPSGLAQLLADVSVTQGGARPWAWYPPLGAWADAASRVLTAAVTPDA